MRSNINNEKLKATFLEQLNQPNLSQEKISWIQQQRQILAIQTKTITEQLDSKYREYYENRRQHARPQYNQILQASMQASYKLTHLKI